MPADRIRLLDQHGMIWDRLDTAWTRAFGELAAFKDEHGHFEVPMDLRTADGTGLAEWAGTQRDALRQKKLTAQRRELLDSIGFPWKPAEAKWQRQYQKLAEALSRCGGRSGLKHRTPEATWLEGQLLSCHQGKLSEEKIALLEKLGITVRREDPWMAAYRAYTGFKAGHGHLIIPDCYTTADGISLSEWQRDQRRRRKDGRMTRERERLLTEAGITWDPTEEAWNAMYQEAAAAIRDHGGLSGLPRGHRVKEWAYRQRKLHDKGTLPARRAGLLRELGILAGPVPPGQPEDPPESGTDDREKGAASARRTGT
jgi:hypothetical protein